MSEPAQDVASAAADERMLAGQRVLLEQIARAVPLRTVLANLVELAETCLAGARASVMVLDDGRLRVAAAPRVPAGYRDLVDGLAVDPAASASAFFADGVLAADIAVDDRWQPLRTVALENGLLSCWSTPLCRPAGSGRPLGLLAIYFPDVRTPTAADVAAVDICARTAALAVDRQRVEAARQAARGWESQAQDDLRFVLDATTTLAGSLDRDQTVRMLAELAVSWLAPLAAVDLIDGMAIDRAAVAARDGVPAEVVTGIRTHPPRLGSDSPIARVLVTGHEEVVLSQQSWMPDDVRADADHVEALEAVRATGYACFPLTARGSTFGVLSLLATADEPLADRVVALARELADRASLAIDNAEQYARREEAARELEALNTRLRRAAETHRQVALSLQHAMLPAPRLEGADLEVAVRYRPADDEMAIGGDWYDVLVDAVAHQRPGGMAPVGPLVSVTVGDVVGKGLAAAGVMGQLRSALRAASYSVDGPAASLKVVDRYARTVEGAFATTVVKVRIDVGAGTLRYASAGHPPPVVVGPDGRPTFLDDATRPPLCVDDVADYVEATAPFPAGSMLVMYSDGLVERRDRDIDEGLDWLADAVSRCRDQPVEELADTVLAGSVHGRGASDDTVLVIVRSPLT